MIGVHAPGEGGVGGADDFLTRGANEGARMRPSDLPYTQPSEINSLRQSITKILEQFYF
jgi:hypothetical protein